MARGRMSQLAAAVQLQRKSVAHPHTQAVAVGESLQTSPV